MKLKILIVFLLILICGAAWLMFFARSTSLKPYTGTKPEVDLQTYFDGEIKAWGLIQDWRGRVTARFDIDMVGEWDGNTGVLKETFRYYSGRVDTREWTITKHDDGTYTGVADDIIGTANGRQNGSALAWNYDIIITVDGKKIQLNLDDWMWQMNDGVLINRSYFKKFGIKVAELTVFMQKVK
ncbi:MAG: DUF3833 domain-containing protein [Alphaproteobacteria bacterium]